MSENSHAETDAGSRKDIHKERAGAIRGLPEVFVSNAAISREVSRALKAGRLRKLASRLYTSNLTDSPEQLVGRNLWGIVAGYFPGAIIADRTALEFGPAPDGSVCLITQSGRDIHLPGHVLRPRRGQARLPSDRPFLADLHVASTARAYLENMRPSRNRSGLVARRLSSRELEDRLETLIRRFGEEAANRLRDDIRAVAGQLDMEREASRLDTLVGSMLGTRKVALSAPAAIARQQGRPFDPDRLKMFESLHRVLRDYQPAVSKVPNRVLDGKQTLAFFDAYFSNFIEGTEFAVEEAADIVFRGAIPNDRPQDAHDILGTWRLVSDDAEMARVPEDSENMIQLLRTRHAIILESRPEMGPGIFKQAGNRAGSTLFVAPELVEGTLEQGFNLYRSLETPFQRAVFMMFLIAEVHPFADGNGRTARVMMNVELVAAGEERIVIPTVYRADYIAALKALSLSGWPEPLMRMLDYAQRWTAAVNWRLLPDTRRELEACNAFTDAAVAEREGRRLKMPQKVGK